MYCRYLQRYWRQLLRWLCTMAILSFVPMFMHAYFRGGQMLTASPTTVSHCSSYAPYFYASISTFFKFASLHTFPRHLSVILPQVRAILQQIHFANLVALSICHHTPTTFNMSIVFCFRLRVYSNYHPSCTSLSYIHSQELEKESFAKR